VKQFEVRSSQHLVKSLIAGFDANNSVSRRCQRESHEEQEPSDEWTKTARAQAVNRRSKIVPNVGPPVLQ